MKLLLDTHALLWWLADNPRLPHGARAAISDADNQVLASACVAYEIAYKQRLGKLPALPESLPRSLRRGGIDTLPVSFEHALAAAELGGPHRDPWDRIMIAQAVAENCHMVTIDPIFSRYGVSVIW